MALKRLVLPAALPVLSLGLTACDYGFDAKGRAITMSATPLPKSCRLAIGEVSGGLSCCSGLVDPARIEKHFTVTPGHERFRLTLRCEGFQEYVATGMYGVDMSPSKPFDLGEVALLPKAR